VPAGEASTVTDALVELMSGVATLKVPLKVDVGMGDNWAQAHS